MSVKRYWSYAGGDASMQETETGNYVKYEDYASLERKNIELAVQLANAESKCRELAAESAAKHEFIATCFRAAADGGSMDGADIQELGERLGLFGRETYQPVLHGYICGHEAGEDTVYVMKKIPATDAFLAEVRAQGVDSLAQTLNGLIAVSVTRSYITEFAAKLRKGVKS
ncbi:hypothetical protein OGW02_11135 [Citrobacter sp. Ce105]|uniref:hypothetical protein n=1 Tax=Citrobacter sp. Ce105 TaxID=2985041 RepID=UPI0025755113|nr:hypothetical protein [Citrobacter sp. Ce105]MDM3290191.1 hypothetical protein [Citrobacter sp. Ce105]